MWLRLVVSASLLLVPGFADAQGESFQDDPFQEAWRWAQFTTDSGLPSNRVDGVLETASGGIWAYTNAGLAWYDGYRWHAVSEADGIPAKPMDWVAAFGDDSILVVVDGRLYRGNRHGFEAVPVEVDVTCPPIVGPV